MLRSGCPPAAMRWPRRSATPGVWASLSSSSTWTFAGRKLSWKANHGSTAACFPVSVTPGRWPFSCRGPPRRRRDSSGEPGVQLADRSAEVHGQVRAQRSPGSGPGAARRLLRCSERIPGRWVAPLGNGVRAAFHVLARKRVKHVWTYWGAVLGQLKPALAAHHRLGKSRDGPNPIRAFVRAAARGVAWVGTRSVFPGATPGRSRLELLERRRGQGRVFRDG